MRAYRAVWSPFGAHDQRKRPHKLPDHAVKERPEGRPPLGETAHYTHATPPIKRSSDDAPAPAARPIRRAPRRCAATRAQERRERRRARTGATIPLRRTLVGQGGQGRRGAAPNALSKAWHGLSDASPRPRTPRGWGLSSQLRRQCRQSDRASPATAPPWTESRPYTPRPTARLAGA